MHYKRAYPMKKTCFIMVLAFCISILLCACSMSDGSSIVKTERRLGKYFQNQTNTSTSKPHDGMIDLSEGPKLNYDANFGPQNLNFDIKIVNPY